MRRVLPWLVALLVVVPCACGPAGGGLPDPGAVADPGPADDPGAEAAAPDLEPDPEPDAAAPDAGEATDEAPADPGVDSGPDVAPDLPADLPADLPPDVPPDAPPAVPLPGWGTITGDCGILDDAIWASDQPALFRNAVDLGASGWDLSLLSAGGQEVWKDGNLGGSSVESEALSVDVLYRCELANLVFTEGEVYYLDEGGKKTDEVVDIDGRRVGVSIVRAFHYPPGQPYTAEEADGILRKKLGDVLVSIKNAKPAYAWTRSMVHVLAWDAQHADRVVAAWEALDAATRDSTLVFVTVTDGTDDFVY